MKKKTVKNKKATASKKTSVKKSVKKASVKKETSPTLKIGDQIWPMETNVFFRPARLKYVRKLIKPEGCVFCASAKGGIKEETLCVYQTQYSQIVVNKFPYNSGHVLVLPLRHCGDLLALTPEEYKDLHDTVKIAVGAVKGIYSPQGFNLGLNNGATAGAGIPDHLHFHIVPRWNGDLNFFPLIAETKLVIEEAEASYHRYIEYFSNIKKS